MLSQKHIPIGKLKQAFGLTTQDVDTLLSTLLPDGVFPTTLWKKAYSSFWHGKIDSYAVLYKLDTPPFPERLQFLSFPEVIIDPDGHYYLSKSRERMVVLFIEISSILSADKVKTGLDYIIEETYETGDNIFAQERKDLFETLAIEDKDFAVRFATAANARELIDTIDAKRRAVSLKYFSFLSQMFHDTIVVDKIAAIRELLRCGYFLQREVKGISKALVDRITATLDDHPQGNTPVQSSTSSIVVPRALWDGKSPEAVYKAMDDEGFDKPIIAYVLSEWCEKPNKTKIGRLLGPRGENEHDSTSRSRTYKLLAEAAAFTIITD